MIDSPVLPEELETLPALLEQARFPKPSGLLATHGDWDHLLGRLAFPGVALGCAQSTASACGHRRAKRSVSCARSTKDLLIERPRPLALGSVQSLRCPGAAGSATTSWSCIQLRATPWTGWLSGSRGRACSSPATTSRRSSLRRWATGGTAMPTSRHWSACDRSSPQPSTSYPVTALVPAHSWRRTRYERSGRSGELLASWAYLRRLARTLLLLLAQAT